MSVILSAIWMAALKFKPLRINEPPLGALILLSQAFLKALNKDVANYHTLAYSSILISSATDLPLLDTINFSKLAIDPLCVFHLD